MSTFDRVSRCKAEECRGEILWRESVVTGKRVPLDAAPVESDARLISAMRFHYRILDGERCRPVTAQEWGDHEMPVFISHFRTCPGVKHFGRN